MKKLILTTYLLGATLGVNAVAADWKGSFGVNVGTMEQEGQDSSSYYSLNFGNTGEIYSLGSAGALRADFDIEVGAFETLVTENNVTEEEWGFMLELAPALMYQTPFGVAVGPLVGIAVGGAVNSDAFYGITYGAKADYTYESVRFGVSYKSTDLEYVDVNVPSDRVTGYISYIW